VIPPRHLASRKPSFSGTSWQFWALALPIYVYTYSFTLYASPWIYRLLLTFCINSDLGLILAFNSFPPILSFPHHSTTHWKSSPNSSMLPLVRTIVFGACLSLRFWIYSCFLDWQFLFSRDSLVDSRGSCRHRYERAHHLRGGLVRHRSLFPVRCAGTGNWSPHYSLITRHVTRPFLTWRNLLKFSLFR